MDRSLIKLAAGCATALVLMSATAVTANANYLGYGNGDPGNWDLWTEQNGGPVKKVEAPAPRVRHAHLHHYRHGAHEKHMG
jgi:hypothetical protein